MDVVEQSSARPSWSNSSVMRRIRTLVPVGSKAEIKELSKLAGAVILSQLLIFGVNFISTIFCGHLGKAELAGVALAISVINVTGISIGVGLASACDTLISQTYGSGNLLRVGVILQRAILILLLACFPCWAILINTESILLAVKQEPEVATISQLYVKIFMPALPATFMYALESRYLQNQGIIYPQVITGFVVNIFNALINYILVFVLNLGVAGSAIANMVSQIAMAGVLLTHIMWKGLHKTTWGGWSKECLSDWGSYTRLAVPGMIMLCAEWWCYEIGSFLAGTISEVELASQSVIIELAGIAYMFPLGFSVAGSIRVGNALGAGQTEDAKLSAKLSLLCAGSVAACFAILYGSLKEHIALMFTYDEEVRARVAEIMSFYAPFFILDGMAAAFGGVIRGSGKQKVGALCSILGNYLIALPVGASLMFAAKLGIKGLWTGLLICTFIQSVFFSIYILRMNWTKATTEAQIRAGVRRCSTDSGHQPEDLQAPQGDSVELVEAGQEPAQKAVKSFRTLVLFRVLALAIMLLILAAGITLSLLIPGLIT